MSLPKSAGEPRKYGTAQVGKSGLEFGIGRPKFISLSTISLGVFLGAQMPNRERSD
jgi:hypothetical protein